MNQAKFSLSSLIWPIFGSWLLTWTLGALTAVSSVGLLLVSGWFISAAAYAGLVALGSHTFNYLAPSALIRVFAITRTAGRYGELLVGHGALFELLKRLRERFFVEFAHLSADKRQALSAASAQHRLVKDIDNLSEFALRFVNPWAVAIFVGAALGALLGRLSWFLATPFLLMALLACAFCVGARRLARQESDAQERRQLWLTQRLFATTQLLVWGRFGDFCTAFLKIDKTLAAVYRRQHQMRVAATLLVHLGAFLALMLLFGFAAKEGKSIGAPWLLALVLGILAAAEPFAALVLDPFAYAKSRLAALRLNELVAQDAKKSAALPDDFVWILEDVAVKQPLAVFGARGIKARIEAGKPLAIVGASGAGKSTLLDALAGELKPISGRILLQSPTATIDAADVDFGGALGYLGQNVDIFDQSLGQNLRLGKKDATDDELYAVLEQVGLGAWAQNLPQKLNTPLGEYGAAVSGGQARRVALARLLLSPKKALLLDEPFAGLDKQTRLLVWQLLKQKQKDGFLVVVSHHADILDDDVECLRLGEPCFLGQRRSDASL